MVPFGCANRRDKPLVFYQPRDIRTRHLTVDILRRVIPSGRPAAVPLPSHLPNEFSCPLRSVIAVREIRVTIDFTKGAWEGEAPLLAERSAMNEIMARGNAVAIGRSKQDSDEPSPRRERMQIHPGDQERPAAVRGARLPKQIAIQKRHLRRMLAPAPQIFAHDIGA